MASIQNVMAAFFLSARMPLGGRVLDAECDMFGVVMRAMRRLELVGCDVFTPYLEAVLEVFM